MTDGGDYLLLTEETIYDWWRRLSMSVIKIEESLNFVVKIKL